ncbi:MAG: hypothetical protein R2822_11755 [Spirosomataceae bacterium]
MITACLFNLFWSISIFGDKITRGFEGMWLMIGASWLVLWQSKQYWKLLFFVMALGITLLIALLVADGTRALSFGFIFFYCIKNSQGCYPNQTIKISTYYQCYYFTDVTNVISIK